MNGKIFFLLLFLLLIGAGGWYISQQGKGGEQSKAVKVAAKHGNLDVVVTSTGELKAKSSTKIRGPQGLRGIGQVKILELVPEGTIVKKGEFVARLDESELDKRKDEYQDRVIDARAQVKEVERDTAITLSKLRDRIKELEFSIENKRKEVGINIYEPQEVQDRVQSELEKLQRDYDTEIKNYALEVGKADAKVNKVLSEKNKQYKKVKDTRKMSKQFTVTAPSDGMIVYERDRWQGGKITTGSTISSWNSVVASLPDLSVMVSETYVNEIDISGVKIGQKVEMKVDALPDKTYEGKVIYIGNIGQQRPGFDAKVFDIKIEIMGQDTLLRPSMTTSNAILTESFEDVTYIPLEALHSNEDVNFVFIDKNGSTVRQEVIAGEYNNAQVIIKTGLGKDDEIYLSIPENPDDLELIKLEENEKEKFTQKMNE